MIHLALRLAAVASSGGMDRIMSPEMDIHAVWDGPHRRSPEAQGTLRQSSQDQCGSTAKTLGWDPRQMSPQMSPHGTTNSTGPGFPESEGSHHNKMLSYCNLRAEPMASLPSTSEGSSSWSWNWGRSTRRNSWLESFQGMADDIKSSKEWLTIRRRSNRTSKSSLDSEDHVRDAHSEGETILQER